MEQFLQLKVVALIVACIVGFNLALAGIKAGLDQIKDKTVSTWDNKASDMLAKIITIITKAIDVAGMNPEHKEEAPKVEEKKVV